MPQEFGVGFDALGLTDDAGVLLSSTVTLLLAEMRLRAQEARDAEG